MIAAVSAPSKFACTGVLGLYRHRYYDAKRQEEAQKRFHDHLLVHPGPAECPVDPPWSFLNKEEKEEEEEEPQEQLEQPRVFPSNNYVSWVLKRFNPADERDLAPVPRHKILTPLQLPRPRSFWVAGRTPRPHSFDRSSEEQPHVFRSAISTRCEDWSTLREMLPSRGRAVRSKPPEWEARSHVAPFMTTTSQSRFPHINSEMTSYLDSMFVNDKEFVFK